MPRIRMLRPEHRQHRKVGPLSDREYRLWIGMISEADDYGRLVWPHAAQLRVLTFPYHPKVTTAHVEAAVLALATVGLIALYEVGGVRYACFPSWGDHQKPKFPSKPKLPPPLGLPQDSTSYPPGLGESSAVGSRCVVVGDVDELNRTGLDREGVGVGGETRGAGDGSPAPPRSLAAPSSNHSHLNVNSNGHSAGKGNSPSQAAEARIKEIRASEVYRAGGEGTKALDREMEQLYKVRFPPTLEPEPERIIGTDNSASADATPDAEAETFGEPEARIVLGDFGRALGMSDERVPIEINTLVHAYDAAMDRPLPDDATWERSLQTARATLRQRYGDRDGEILRRAQANFNAWYARARPEMQERIDWAFAAGLLNNASRIAALAGEE